MNWTGGQRQRHSNAPSSLKLRQQQHFAKVRATLLSGKKRSPPNHPNLDRLRALHESNGKPSGPEGFSAQNHNAGRLQSFSTFSLNLQTPYSEESQPLPYYAPQKQAVHAPRRPKRDLDEDLYNATPQPRKKKEREASPLPRVGGMGIKEEESSLSEKRRKILRKGDWVSVGFQRAPQLNFPSRKEEGQVARRRRLTDDHRPQYVRKSRDPWASPVIGIYQPPPFEDLNEPKQKHRQSAVKISVGGKIIPPGIRSSSSTNKRHSRSSRGAQSSRRASKSSDIMLLDNLERTPVQSAVAVKEFRREYGNAGSALPSLLGQPEVPLSFNIYSSASQRSRGIQNTPQPRFTSSSDSLPLHHPRPQSSKVSSILRSTSTVMAGSTTADVGRLRVGKSVSQLGESDIWEAWIDSVLPNDIFNKGNVIGGNSVDDHYRAISPGISAAPTYRFVNEHARESGIGSETRNLSSQESPQFEISDMQEEEEGVEEMETLFSENESDIVDHISTGTEIREPSTQPNESLSESLHDSSPVPQGPFRILSPIPELGSEELPNKPLQDIQCSLASVSSKSSYHSLTNSPSYIQEEDQVGINVHSMLEKENPKPQTNFIQASNKLLGDPFKAQPVEAATDDELWRKFVFGTDNEEIDIFYNDPYDLKTAQLMEQSMMTKCSLNNSMLSMSSRQGMPTETDLLLSSNGYQAPTPDFISQLTNGVSQEGKLGKEDLAVPRILSDFYSTVGNATSIGASSSYFSSSASSSSLATGVVTNVAQRGSTIHSLNNTPPTKPRKRVMFTKPIRFNAGISNFTPS